MDTVNRILETEKILILPGVPITLFMGNFNSKNWVHGEDYVYPEK